MKRLFKMVLLVIAFGFASQGMHAQTLTESPDKPDVVAKAEVAKISKTLKLTDDQERTLFRVFLAKEVNYRKNIKGKDANNPNVKQSVINLEKNFLEGMKASLTEKQFNKWKSMQ
ncbi:MAG: hypothetical protein ABJM06_14260 [Gilvibacter sp.]